MNKQFQKLLDARAFFFVRAIKVAYSKSERGYMMTLHFQVSSDKSTHKKLRFYFEDLDAAHEAIKGLLKCHQEFHPDDQPLIALWTLYLEDFLNNPLNGLSLYRPENIQKP